MFSAASSTCVGCCGDRSKPGKGSLLSGPNAGETVSEQMKEANPDELLTLGGAKRPLRSREESGCFTGPSVPAPRFDVDWEKCHRADGMMYVSPPKGTSARLAREVTKQETSILGRRVEDVVFEGETLKRTAPKHYGHQDLDPSPHVFCEVRDFDDCFGSHIQHEHGQVVHERHKARMLGSVPRQTGCV